MLVDSKRICGIQGAGSPCRLFDSLSFLVVETMIYAALDLLFCGVYAFKIQRIVKCPIIYFSPPLCPVKLMKLQFNNVLF